MPHAASMLNISSIKGENYLVSAERERALICLSVCVCLIKILAINSRGRVQGRKFSCPGLKIAPPASPSRTKAALGSPISHYPLLNANDLGGVVLNSLILPSS